MRSHSEEGSQAVSAQRYLAPVRDYKNTALKLFPELGRTVLESCSVSSSGALFLGYFLDHLPQKTVVLEIGTSTGVSTLWFAEHPKVSRVISVNLNTPMAEEVAVRGGALPGEKDSKSLKDVGTLEVARVIVEEYPEEREKIHFYEGSSGGLPETLKETNSSEAGDGLVVFVDGLRTREIVAESLNAIFGLNPHAVVFLNDCRHGWGPFVQAGVVDFMEQTEDQYYFHLIGDLGPALSGSSIGVLYSGTHATKTGTTLERVSREFSRKLDPLRLLGREEELMNTVSKVNRQLVQTNEQKARLQKQVSRLKKRDPELEAQLEKQKVRNAALLVYYSSRRYKLVDALATTLKKLPLVKGLLRKNPPYPGGD